MQARIMVTMYAPPPPYGAPPVYRKNNTTAVVLIVVGVVLGVGLLCCVGGVALYWRSGVSDVFSCTSLTAQGNYRAAIPPCRVWVTKQPESSLAHNELGWDLALDGQASEALIECKKAVELEPNSNYYDSLAMATAVSGQGEAALEIEKQHVMVGGDVQDPAERLTLGMAYYASGRKEDARKQWDLAKRSSDVTTRRLAAEFEAKHSG